MQETLAELPMTSSENSKSYPSKRAESQNEMG